MTGGFVLENQFLRATVRRDGHLTSLMDLRTQRETIDGRANHFVIFDDVPVANAETFQGELGISSTAMTTLGSQISFKDPNRRIESVGQAQGTQVMISVVTKLNSSPIQYFLWSEQ